MNQSTSNLERGKGGKGLGKCNVKKVRKRKRK